MSRVQISRLPPSPFALIETRLCLVTQQPAFNHLGENFRHHEHFALRIVGKIFMQFLTTCANTSRPTRSNVRNVAVFGRPAAGPVILSTSSIEYPSSIIVDRQQRAVRADAIRNEVRTILRDDDTFAQPLIEEPGNRA